MTANHLFCTSLHQICESRWFRPIPDCPKAYLVVQMPSPFVLHDFIRMTSQTMSTTRVKAIQGPQLLHLIGSNAIRPYRSISRSSGTDLRDLTIRTKTDDTQNSSFDSAPISPAWYVRPPPNTSRLGFWLILSI